MAEPHVFSGLIASVLRSLAKLSTYNDKHRAEAERREPFPDAGVRKVQAP
jgi:hypothetical protein